MGGASATDIGLGIATGGAYNLTKGAIDLLTPTKPNLPTPPSAPDPADAAVRNARLMERRKQLGLTGRMSTFITTSQGSDGGGNGKAAQPPSTVAPVVNLLGG
jgi:hypothetical protein